MHRRWPFYYSIFLQKWHISRPIEQGCCFCQFWINRKCATIGREQFLPILALVTFLAKWHVSLPIEQGCCFCQFWISHIFNAKTWTLDTKQVNFTSEMCMMSLSVSSVFCRLPHLSSPMKNSSTGSICSGKKVH